jgi:ABC-type transport system substrate-binding protein
MIAARSPSIVAIAIALAGCRSHADPLGVRREGLSPARGGVMRLATTSDVRGLDPAVAYDTESQTYVDLIFDGVVGYDLEGNLVPALAERWDVSDDGLVYRFFLRANVLMQDGNVLDAHDVVRSIERALHPDTPCPGAQFYERIAGLADYQARRSEHLAGVVAEDDRVVRVTLSRADPTFVHMMAMVFARPVCRSAGARYDDGFSAKACGAGPFALASMEPGVAIRLRRFDGHYDAAHVYLDGVELKMNTSKITQKMLFERGEIDFLYELERPDWRYFRTHPIWSKYGIERIERAIFGESLNTEMPPFTDVRVRQAFAAAFNRPNLAKYVEGGSQVATRVIPPGVPGHDDGYVGQTFDLPRARRLMAEAGYPYDPTSGRGGLPAPVTYLTGEGDSALRWAQLVQYDLAQIGVQMPIRVVSFAQFLAMTGRPKTVAMSYVGWNMDFPDASNLFEARFSSHAIAAEESQNISFYRNDAFDALLDRAHDERDPKRRAAMYSQADRIVCEDAVWMLSYTPKRFELTQPWVHDYVASPASDRNFKSVWIDAGGRTRHASAAPLGDRVGAALGMLLPRTFHLSGGP